MQTELEIHFELINERFEVSRINILYQIVNQINIFEYQ